MLAGSPKGPGLQGGLWGRQVLFTALCPFQRVEAKAESEGMRKCPLWPCSLLPMSLQLPCLQSVLGLGGLSEEERKALLHLMPKWVPPPISENQKYETGVCLA